MTAWLRRQTHISLVINLCRKLSFKTGERLLDCRLGLGGIGRATRRGIMGQCVRHHLEVRRNWASLREKKMLRPGWIGVIEFASSRLSRSAGRERLDKVVQRPVCSSMSVMSNAGRLFQGVYDQVQAGRVWLMNHVDHRPNMWTADQ